MCVSENQPVCGVTTICLTHCNPSSLNRVDRVVGYGLWNVDLLLRWLCEVAGYWQELEHTVISAERPNHAYWVTCSMSMLTMQELRSFLAFRNCVQFLAIWGHALS